MSYIKEPLDKNEKVNNNIKDAETTINEDTEIDKFSDELSFKEFLKKAEVILVDNAFEFDINEWEKENQEEINKELSDNTKM